MKIQNKPLPGEGQIHPKPSKTDIFVIRQRVISGDWTAINNRTCTLTDLGLRHNGSGLVWLRSGVSVHEADHDAGLSGKDKSIRSVNGLPLNMVSQWSEIWTHRSFAVSVPADLRRQYYPDDAAFSKAMREAGYVPVRTRKLTGKKESFWLYRVTGNDWGVCPAEPASRKVSGLVVQAAETERRNFKRIALDGKWLHVYVDHIPHLEKKRHRVDGVRVQGYTAGGLKLEVMA